MTDLERPESTVAQLVRSIDLLCENDRRLATALNSLHNRMLLQEAGTAMYEVSQDRSLN